MSVLSKVKKALTPNSDEKEKKKKDEDVDDQDLEAIGLSPAKNSSDVSIHREDGTYISHANIAEVQKNYGTIHEYLKQRHGPGRYTVTARGKGKEFTQHISIAGDNESQQMPSSPWPENPTGADNNIMALYMAMQTENAQLKAQLEASKVQQQQSTWAQFLPAGIELLKSFMVNRPEIDIAGVMGAATEYLKTLSEIKAPGSKDEDLGGLMSSIAQLGNTFMANRQQPQYIPQTLISPQPQPQPQFISSPAPQSRQATPPPAPPQSAPTAPVNQVNVPEETVDVVDNFLDGIVGAIEQRQDPAVIADYVVSNIKRIPPEEMQKLDPQWKAIIQNPFLVFNAICQFEPALAADAKYMADIQAELQKRAEGVEHRA